MAITTKLNGEKEYFGEMCVKVNNEKYRVKSIITKENSTKKTLFRHIKDSGLAKGVLFITNDNKHIVYTRDFVDYSVVYTDTSESLYSIASNKNTVCAYKKGDTFYSSKCVHSNNCVHFDENSFIITEGGSRVTGIYDNAGVINHGNKFYTICKINVNNVGTPQLKMSTNGYEWNDIAHFYGMGAYTGFTFFKTVTYYQGEPCDEYIVLVSSNSKTYTDSVYFVDKNGEEHFPTGGSVQSTRNTFTSAICTDYNCMFSSGFVTQMSQNGQVTSTEAIDDSVYKVFCADGGSGRINYRASLSDNKVLVYSGAYNLICSFTLTDNFYSFVRKNDDLILYDASHNKYTLNTISMELTANGEAQYVPAMSILDQKPMFTQVKK